MTQQKRHTTGEKSEIDVVIAPRQHYLYTWEFYLDKDIVKRISDYGFNLHYV